MSTTIVSASAAKSPQRWVRGVVSSSIGLTFPLKIACSTKYSCLMVIKAFSWQTSRYESNLAFTRGKNDIRDLFLRARFVLGGKAGIDGPPSIIRETDGCAHAFGCNRGLETTLSAASPKKRYETLRFNIGNEDIGLL